MKNVLIISGHTNLEQSFANKIILDEVAESLPMVTQVHLDKLYPTYRIDVEAEQQRLVNADAIVLQFPFFWYSVPSLMKKWLEDVFVHGFSHGSSGDKVKGKKLLISFTSGAPAEMYQSGGLQNYPIEEFLTPLKQFANLCGLQCAGYLYTGGLSYTAKSEEQRVKMRGQALEHAQKLIKSIKQLGV